MAVERFTAAITMSCGTDRIGRREFVVGSASALVTLLHADELFANNGADRKQIDTGPLIRALRLQTATPLSELKAFYVRKLGLQFVRETDRELTIAGGATPITFVHADDESPAPFYHFAFNIPQNKIRAARAWQLQRSPLISTPPALRDGKYPNDVRHFANWNAHSIFFWDPAGNLVEYIARHDLKNDAKGAFTSRDILHVSEIGFIVDERERGDLARSLGGKLDLAGYKPESGGFVWALGDERGLLLLLPRGLRDNVDPSRWVEFSVFRTEATIRGETAGDHWFDDHPYLIKVR